MKQEDLAQRLIQIRAIILGYVRVIVRDSHLAEDIFQDTYLTALKRIGTFDRSGDFDRWVLGIAKNLARNALRKRAHMAMMPSSELVAVLDECHEEGSGEENDEMAYRLQRLHDCMEKLPPQQRRLMDLRYAVGDSMRAIAETTESTPGAVQVAISRIRRALLGCIEKQESENSYADEAA